MFSLYVPSVSPLSHLLPSYIQSTHSPLASLSPSTSSFICRAYFSCVSTPASSSTCRSIRFSLPLRLLPILCILYLSPPPLTVRRLHPHSPMSPSVSLHCHPPSCARVAVLAPQSCVSSPTKHSFRLFVVYRTIPRHLFTPHLPLTYYLFPPFTRPPIPTINPLLQCTCRPWTPTHTSPRSSPFLVTHSPMPQSVTCKCTYVAATAHATDYARFTPYPHLRLSCALEPEAHREQPGVPSLPPTTPPHSAHWDARASPPSSPHDHPAPVLETWASRCSEKLCWPLRPPCVYRPRDTCPDTRSYSYAISIIYVALCTRRTAPLPHTHYAVVHLAAQSVPSPQQEGLDQPATYTIPTPTPHHPAMSILSTYSHTHPDHDRLVRVHPSHSQTCPRSPTPDLAHRSAKSRTPRTPRAAPPISVTPPVTRHPHS
ncbi:hypothetical protein CRENBAI_023823 [Crenichthys baileyi]|uniref:Uncharacterized protein n=1 Tax=Crenichthys baileyi TaxID=28760 RepID=A0AAV9S9B6_9TELE